MGLKATTMQLVYRMDQIGGEEKMNAVGHKATKSAPTNCFRFQIAKPT